MARPKKKGLDYFPLEVYVFENEKLFDVQNEYGPLGEAVYLRLLCMVYKNGYYYQFESIDRLASFLMKNIGNRWMIDKNQIIEIIRYLGNSNLFDRQLLEINVLTSKEIQIQYLKIRERRNFKIDEYKLIDDKTENEVIKEDDNSKKSASDENSNENINSEKNGVYDEKTGVNDVETPVNIYQNTIKEKKVNESKRNEKKVNESESKVNESKVNESICAVIPCLDGNFTANDNLVETLQKQYPETDVKQALNKIETMMTANPQKQKTINRMYSYINMWLNEDNMRALKAKQQPDKNIYIPNNTAIENKTENKTENNTENNNNTDIPKKFKNTYVYNKYHKIYDGNTYDSSAYESTSIADIDDEEWERIVRGEIR